MRIGINALFWIPDAMGGTQTYFRNLVNSLGRIDPDDEFVVFLNREGARAFSNASARLRVQACPVPGRIRSFRLLWENVLLPRYVQRHQLDVLHSLGYIAPLAPSVPSVVTVLDMIHYIYPSEIGTLKRLLWKVLFPLSLRRADSIISVSESVKRDIGRFFPWATPKIASVPLGVDPRLFDCRLPGRAAMPLVQKVRPYLLAVASASRHKNLETLVRAFARVRGQTPGLQLVLAGMRTAGLARVERLVGDLSLSPFVHFAGRVSDAELVELYCNAEALVFPSLYEGFGLPTLEAMACNCPVIAADCSSIPEVVGNAGLLFDATDVEMLREAITRLIASQQLRSELVRLGRERAKKFTWEVCAGQTVAVYRAVRGRRR
jgi:glycosyltransferase involved in cell wall biosynthesis